MALAMRAGTHHQMLGTLLLRFEISTCAGSESHLHCWRSSKMTDIDALCQLDMLDNEWTSSSVMPEDWHQVRMAQRT